MAMKNEQTMKQTVKDGARAILLTLCAIGCAYGAVQNATGAVKVYHTQMDSAFEKTTRVGVLGLSALYLAYISGSLIDIGVAVRRQKQARRLKDNTR